MGNYTVQRWEELFRFLMVKYLDGNLKKEENGVFLTNNGVNTLSLSIPTIPNGG
jgi:hypothetical protein